MRILFTGLLLFPFGALSAQGDIRQEVIAETGHAWDGSSWQYPAAAPQVTLLRLRVPPDTQLPWHQHPMLNLAYVERGEITVERRADGLTRTYRQGEAIAETMNVPHRGMTGNDGVQLLIFYAGAAGMPLSVAEGR